MRACSFSLAPGKTGDRRQLPMPGRRSAPGIAIGSDGELGDPEIRRSPLAVQTSEGSSALQTAPPKEGKIVRAARRDEPESAVGEARQGEGSARVSIGDLRLVHGRTRYARSARREGAAGSAREPDPGRRRDSASFPPRHAWGQADPL